MRLADHHRRHVGGRELGDLAAAGLLAAAQHGHLVGEGHHLAELVGDHEDGELAGVCHAAHEAEHLVGLLRRQHRGRLVEDKQSALEIELLQDLELLLLAGRERADRHVERNLERHARQEVVEALPLAFQSITAGTSARAITRFSATVIDGTSVKCW